MLQKKEEYYFSTPKFFEQRLHLPKKLFKFKKKQRKKRRVKIRRFGFIKKKSKSRKFKQKNIHFNDEKG